MSALWNWVTDHWPWLAGAGGIAVAVAAFAVLNPVAAVRLASSLAGLAADSLRGITEWLRKPGNKLKAACALLAALAAIGALLSYDLNREITIVRVERDTAVRERGAAIGERDTARTRLSELEGTLATYREQEQQFAAIQRQRTQQLERVQQQNVAALAEIDRLRAQAEASDRAWWRVYQGRSDVCRAAEEALDVACAEVGKF